MFFPLALHTQPVLPLSPCGAVPLGSTPRPKYVTTPSPHPRLGPRGCGRDQDVGFEQGSRSSDASGSSSHPSAKHHNHHNHHQAWPRCPSPPAAHACSALADPQGWFPLCPLPSSRRCSRHLGHSHGQPPACHRCGRLGPRPFETAPCWERQQSGCDWKRFKLVAGRWGR